MRHIPRYLHMLVQCALWLSFGANASVVVDNVDNINFSTVIAITGEITRGDAATISDLVRHGAQKEKRLSFQYHVLLDSPGGDLDAAMAIGRTLKTTTSMVVVQSLDGKWGQPDPKTGLIDYERKPATCASACVVILAAGSMKSAYVGRHSRDRVGIHRPYSTAAGATTTAQGAARYTAMAARVRAYLEEIGMPNSLYEEMMLVSPQKVRWLTMVDLDRLGLIGWDPAYEDATDSQGAARRGISKQEFLRRKSLADEACVNHRQSGRFDSSAEFWRRQEAEDKKFVDCLKHVYDYGSAPR